MSQSPNIIKGDFPPSSSDTRFALLSAQLFINKQDEILIYDNFVSSNLFIMTFPISVDPVNPIFLTSI